MRINTNISAINAHTNMQRNQVNLGKSAEKLSSGLRINRAADDAAGLAVSETMRAEIRGMSQAKRNAQDGISLIQTAEGAMNEVSDMLVRMKELEVQKASGTYSTTDTANIDAELSALKAEVGNINTSTKFNGTAVFSTAAVTLQIGAVSETLDVTVGTIATIATGIGGVDTAIGAVTTARSNLGALQNRLEHTVNNLSTTYENLSAAESRIRDTDMAEEMMKFTKSNIIAQASQSMLAQANAQPQGVLSLLQ